MNENDRALYEALFSREVADRETIRSRVLARAHAEGPDDAAESSSMDSSSPAAPPARRTKHSGRFSRIAAIPLAACAAFFLLLNLSAPFAKAVEHVPLLSNVARLITFRQWTFSDGASSIQGSQPLVEGTGDASFESAVNMLIDDKLSALDAAAKADAAEYRKNWIAMGNDADQFVPIRYTFDYETYYAQDGLLSFLIRQRKTVTTNTEDTYTTLFYYNLDVATGADLTFEDVLGPDWQEAVRTAVDTQIRAAGDTRKLSYYEEFWLAKNVPWDETQRFYLNSDGAVTVVLDEGWIAPFEDGPQSFVIGPALNLKAR